MIVDQDRLIGIVTDRDLVRRGLARGLSANASVDGVMSAPVVTIDADSDLHDAFALFRANAFRRLPVVRHGRFVGMYSVDDLLVNIAAELHDLRRPAIADVLFPHRGTATP